MDPLTPAPVVIDAVHAVARADVARCLAGASALRAAVQLASSASRSDDLARAADAGVTSGCEPDTDDP